MQELIEETLQYLEVPGLHSDNLHEITPHIFIGSSIKEQIDIIISFDEDFDDTEKKIIYIKKFTNAYPLILKYISNDKKILLLDSHEAIKALAVFILRRTYLREEAKEYKGYIFPKVLKYIKDVHPSTTLDKNEIEEIINYEKLIKSKLHIQTESHAS